MSAGEFFAYLAVMAGVTYLIRAVPLAVFSKKITNKTVKSFLYYVPYAVLSAMTVPAVFYSTGSVWSALAGLAVAVALALCEKSLITVALLSCLAAFVAERFI
ncbi:MAG: AzlD domain-containing protein [Ruminococcaceae bacterium]|jgi:branched-subunit amino acid transport protein|nr:AzlD domain-containing protein [Oscillospiraceae bacterium]